MVQSAQESTPLQSTDAEDSISTGTILPNSASTPSPTFSPLYQQIKGLLTQSLQAAEWRPGEMIPSEMELAKRYNVSQGTVRKAIDELAAENILVRRQGKGTFVATHHEDKVTFRFLRLMPDDGSAEYPKSQVLACKRLRAAQDVAKALELKVGDAVVMIQRVLFFQQVPTVLEEIWLPGLQFKGLTAERLATYKGPMYGLFEAEFGTRMIRASEKIHAVAADEACASSLQVGLNTPLLRVERVAFTYGDKPVELRRGFYRTDRHSYHNELS